MRSSLFVNIKIVSVALMVATVLAACSSEEETQVQRQRSSWGSRELPVTTAQIERAPLIDSIKSVGTARAQQSVTLYPESAGVVTFAKLAPDLPVAAGEVLLRLDDRDQTLAVRQAEVELAEAKRTLQRYLSLNMTEANIPQSTIDTAQSSVDLAEIRLSQAKVELSRRVVNAPFAGRIGITDVEIGDRVDTSTVVTTLDDRSVLLVDFTVPESFIGKIVTGLNVDARQWESPDDNTRGTIVAVDSRVDSATRAFRARAAIDNSSDNLRPGMAFEIDASISKGEYLSVPELAVQWGADGPFVWSATGDRATRSPVEMVRRVDGRMLIRGDVLEGQRVILEGIQSVRPGMKINDLSSSQISAKPKNDDVTRSSQGS
jgi:RND family efflux transporter MFP subunit